MLAILYAINQLRPYIYGRNFTLVTDHRPLVWVNNVKTPNSRIVRWRLALQDYDFTIIYKPGKVNSNADALSRNIPENDRQPQELKENRIYPINIDSNDSDTIFNPRKRRFVTASESETDGETQGFVTIFSETKRRKTDTDSGSEIFPSSKKRKIQSSDTTELEQTPRERNVEPNIEELKDTHHTIGTNTNLEAPTNENTHDDSRPFTDHPDPNYSEEELNPIDLCNMRRKRYRTR